MEAVVDRLQQLEAALTAQRDENMRLQAVVAQMAAQIPPAQAPPAPAPTPSSSQVFSPLIDTRMLTKPQSLSGKDEDWMQWSVLIRAYCGALDPKLAEDMAAAEMSDVEIANRRLSEEVSRRSCSLFYILVM